MHLSVSSTLASQLSKSNIQCPICFEDYERKDVIISHDVDTSKASNLSKIHPVHSECQQNELTCSTCREPYDKEAMKSYLKALTLDGVMTSSNNANPGINKPAAKELISRINKGRVDDWNLVELRDHHSSSEVRQAARRYIDMISD